LRDLPEFVGVSRTMIQDMIDRGLLHPFNLTGRGRSKVVLESEVAELQQKGFAAARAKAKAEASVDDEDEADARKGTSPALPPERKRP
jgi:hypothetical protein